MQEHKVHTNAITGFDGRVMDLTVEFDNELHHTLQSYPKNVAVNLCQKRLRKKCNDLFGSSKFPTFPDSGLTIIAFNAVLSHSRHFLGMYAPDGKAISFTFKDAESQVPASNDRAREQANSLKPEALLRRIDFFVPRKHREEILGDLHEDIAERRSEGASEKKLLFYVVYQVAWSVISRLMKWGVFAWIAKTVHSMLAK